MLGDAGEQGRGRCLRPFTAKTRVLPLLPLCRLALVRFVLSFFEKAEPKLTVRPNPVSTMITLAARIAEEHPRAAPLAYRIRTEAEELRAEPTPRPISAARTDDPERTLLLFCPEQGGWQTGVFFES